MSKTRLFIDSGNTRIKWRLLIQDGSIQEGHCAQAEFRGHVFKSLPVPQEIWIANVAAAPRLLAIRESCRDLWNLQATVATPDGEFKGLSNGYSMPSTLGIDRWLNLICARSQTTQPSLIISAGTALTLDALTDAGQHLGGWILPGLHSLAHAAVTQADPSVTHTLFKAIQHGASLLRQHVNAPIKVFLTGGDAERLIMEWPTTSIPQPILVIDSVIQGLIALADHQYPNESSPVNG